MRLGGGESCCGDFSRSEFCLNDFFRSKIGFVVASARLYGAGEEDFFHIFCDFCVKQLTLCYGF